MEQNNLNNDSEQKSPNKRFLFILGVSFVVAYIILGSIIIFKPGLFMLSPTNRTILGSAMILYGVFRCYRLIKKESEYE